MTERERALYCCQHEKNLNHFHLIFHVNTMQFTTAILFLICEICHLEATGTNVTRENSLTHCWQNAPQVSEKHYMKKCCGTVLWELSPHKASLTSIAPYLFFRLPNSLRFYWKFPMEKRGGIPG